MAFFKHLRPKDAIDDARKYSYIEVDANDMRIFDKRCFATYAGEGELIVLLKDDDKKVMSV
jgi:hypothetical protein